MWWAFTQEHYPKCVMASVLMIFFSTNWAISWLLGNALLQFLPVFVTDKKGVWMVATYDFLLEKIHFGTGLWMLHARSLHNTGRYQRQDMRTSYLILSPLPGRYFQSWAIYHEYQIRNVPQFPFIFQNTSVQIYSSLPNFSCTTIYYYFALTLCTKWVCLMH